MCWNNRVCSLHSCRLKRRSTTSSTPWCTWCLFTFSGKEVCVVFSPFIAKMKSFVTCQTCHVIIPWHLLSLDGIPFCWWPLSCCFTMVALTAHTTACCMMLLFFSTVWCKALHATEEQMKKSVRRAIYSVYSPKITVYVREGSTPPVGITTRGSAKSLTVKVKMLLT